MWIAVAAGHPAMTTSNFTDVAFNVTVAVPAQDASASVIAGTSFDDLRSALKTFATVGTGVGATVGAVVGVAVGAAAVPPQAATRIAVAAMPANTRIFDPPCGFNPLYGLPDRSDEEAASWSRARPSRPVSTDSVEDGHPSRAEVPLRL